MVELTVTVSGPVGSGKSAILGEIEIALKAIGVSVRYAESAEAEQEARMTHADWIGYIEMYEPSVVLVEKIERST
jgi:Ni2+-binding GTPase involved in maturation of urease and hydrogenase